MATVREVQGYTILHNRWLVEKTFAVNFDFAKFNDEANL
jgi:hypothetical protein